MRRQFNRIIILAITACFLFCLPAFAATCTCTCDEMRPPDHPRGKAQPLTDAQKAQVKSILSQYNAASLTAADAKAIFEAFRAAGLRGGPDLLEAIKAAGFDPEKIRALAPPPGRPPEGSRPPDQTITKPAE